MECTRGICCNHHPVGRAVQVRRTSSSIKGFIMCRGSQPHIFQHSQMANWCIAGMLRPSGEIILMEECFLQLLDCRSTLQRIGTVPCPLAKQPSILASVLCKSLGGDSVLSGFPSRCSTKFLCSSPSNNTILVDCELKLTAHSLFTNNVCYFFISTGRSLPIE